MSNKIGKMPFDEFLDVITSQPVKFWACPICDGSRVKWDKDTATCLNCKRTNNTVSPDSETASVVTSTITEWYYLPKVPEIGIPVIVAGIFKEEPDQIKAWYMGGGKWKSQASKEEIQDWQFQIYAWAYERLPVAPPVITSSDKEETTITLYVSNLIRTTAANTLINIMGGLKILAYYSKEEAESNQIRGHNDALNTAIAKINSYIDQHQPPSDKAELDPDISGLLKLAEGDRFGRLDYYPRDWAIPEATQEDDDE